MEITKPAHRRADCDMSRCQKVIASNAALMALAS
nr:MAG TPA: hypothetical protein [Caudoviricetes sp.]